MQVISQGSVRVDLTGGTLDIPPINLILKDVITLNAATSLKANVVISKTSESGVEIVSSDYNKTIFFPSSEFTKENIYYSNHFKEFKFVTQVIDLFKINKNLKVELSSGAPAGSGLGGSSAMGVTLYQGLCQFSGVPFSREEAILKVNSTEGRILNSGMPGYQDYYPALYGGILALHAKTGKVEVEQLYNEQLNDYLSQNVSLIFSGESRLSGINNWEVYKAFFDKNEMVVSGLQKIAQISNQAYAAIKEKNYSALLNHIKDEGEERKKLFPNIMTPLMNEFFFECKKVSSTVGIKVCGAGGGGCFLLIHPGKSYNDFSSIVLKYSMKRLEFNLLGPI